MLALAALGASAVFGKLVALRQFRDFLFKIHGLDYSRTSRSLLVRDWLNESHEASDFP
jgi:hypothetical protein